MTNNRSNFTAKSVLSWPLPVLLSVSETSGVSPILWHSTEEPFSSVLHLLAVSH